ncbi:hypothetical protein Q5A84_14085 [Staphylococcus aureus]|uniref:hypothetical protein n=1 Tax=Staphylococcus TaxID=1279 RepID=UPI000598F65A|nr:MULTISPECIES: hypothetical protein [Staphylococcus]KII19366.1 hypothetical protein JN533_26600 [Staphylococcus aureus]MDO6977725.1 hypothetical protein [Staphylococcus aureus]MDO6989508.1 hypothetical protein [Staphylococcus aureus]MDO6997537.1 hypothetical protein [Staphylococcus aureus]MDO7000228.1 hypothetical protein [Staphylococcus aureus]
MSQNSEIKNKVISGVISIITAIALIIINISSIEVREKIIYSIIFIAILLLLLILINIISFTRIDKKSYEVIRKDLEKIGGMLESIRINDNNISVERLSEFSDFANYYYGKSTVVMFSNIKAKMKFKSLCKSLANLENFIWDNHLDNAGGLTIRVSFIGSRSGVYDRNKHEKQEENEEKYQKLFIKALNDYRSFRKYCENRL